MDFGTVDPAAFVFAIVALLVALEALLAPLRGYVQRPRKAYTEFYRDSMIFSHEPNAKSEYDYILSLAVSKTVFFSMWSWCNGHAIYLMDTPIGFAQWILYPAAQSGSALLVAIIIIMVTPYWIFKFAFVRLVLLSFRMSRHKQSQRVFIGNLFGLEWDTSQQFHRQVLGNIIFILDRYSSPYGIVAQEVLSRLALSMNFPLGGGTLAFAKAGSSGIWTGVWHDLSVNGASETTPGYLDVMAGNVVLQLQKGTCDVHIPSIRSYLGCSKGSRHDDTGKMIRILLSHGIVTPIDWIVDTWGITSQQLKQVRFTHTALQRDTSLIRRLHSAKHWTNRKVVLGKKLSKLVETSPWCDCYNFCFCSLRGIMLTPPVSDYQNFRGVVVCSDEDRTMENAIIQQAGAKPLAGRNAVDLLESVPLLVAGRKKPQSFGHAIIYMSRLEYLKLQC